MESIPDTDHEKMVERVTEQKKRLVSEQVEKGHERFAGLREHLPKVIGEVSLTRNI